MPVELALSKIAVLSTVLNTPTPDMCNQAYWMDFYTKEVAPMLATSGFNTLLDILPIIPSANEWVKPIRKHWQNNRTFCDNSEAYSGNLRTTLKFTLFLALPGSG